MQFKAKGDKKTQEILELLTIQIKELLTCEPPIFA